MGHKPWDHYVSYAVKANFNAAVFTKLLNIDSKYNIGPGIIKNWRWNGKINSYILEIDTTLKFSSDRSVTPKDIEFAILKNFISTVPETDKKLFYDILGVEKLKKGSKFSSGMCTGIQQIGPNQLRITLKTPNPNFLYSLGELVAPVAPIEDFKKDMFSFNRIPRGTGNFKVIWSAPKSSMIRIERKIKNASANTPYSIDIYNHGLPLDNGVDIGIGAGSYGAIDDKRYRIARGAIPKSIGVIDFNHTNPISANKLFRKAISLAINRKDLVSGYKFNRETHELIPSMYYGRTGQKFEYSPEKARVILKKHFPHQLNQLKEHKAIFHGSNKSGLPKYILTLQKQLKNIGLNFNFYATDAAYFKDNNKDALIAIYGSPTPYVDPLVAFSNYIPVSTIPSHTDPNDKISLKLFKLAQVTTSKDDRHLAIKKLGLHMKSLYRQLPFAERYPRYVFSKKIKNLNLEETSYTLDFTKITLNIPNSEK